MAKDIISYLVEQMERYNKKNLQFEKDILFTINRDTQKLVNASVNSCTGDITNIIRLNALMTSIDKIFRQFNSSYRNILLNKIETYYKTGYNQCGELIDIGNEVSNSHSGVVKEMQQNSEDTLDIVKVHAFELLGNYSDAKINDIRATLTDMFLRGSSSKVNVRNMIQKKLDTNISKAEEIAQTELSRIYNIGTLARMREYTNVSGESVKKYWYGFKYSEVTCAYCAERIGEVYDIDDDEETLPAHVRCRCCWIPIVESWDVKDIRKIFSRANLVNTAYSKDMIYNRINSRLGINYADMMDINAASDYISGDRSAKVNQALVSARDKYISDTVDSFGISPDTSGSKMSSEFNTQMNFWKKYTAGLMADNDQQGLYNSKEAIRGVMVLPWNADQMSKWSALLSKIK